MLCSKCKNREATIYINEPTKEDKNNLVGYCNICAKEKGISIDNNLNIVFHDKKINNYVYRYCDIKNYEIRQTAKEAS